MGGKSSSAAHPPVELISQLQRRRDDVCVNRNANSEGQECVGLIGVHSMTAKHPSLIK